MSDPGPWRTKPASIPRHLLDLIDDSRRNGHSTPASTIAGSGLIPEGERNTQLFRLAGRLHAKGHDKAETVNLLRAVNATQCEPPLEDGEVTGLVDRLFARHAKDSDQALPRATCALTAPRPKPLEWIVHGLIPAGEPMLIVADGGVGKSTFALQVSSAVAGGFPPFEHLPFRVTEGTVLYVSEEDTGAILLNRLNALTAGHGHDRKSVHNNFHYFARHGVSLDHAGWQEHLLAEVKRLDARLVVLDPLAGLTAAEENSNTEMGSVIRFFRRLASETGAGVAILHHAGKMVPRRRKLDRVRGASAMGAAARAIYFLDRHQDGLRVDCLKMSYAEPPAPFFLKRLVEVSSNNPGAWRSARLEYQSLGAREMQQAEDWILSTLDKSTKRLNSSELKRCAKGTGHSALAISAAIKQLRGSGKIEFDDGPRGEHRWRLSRSTDNPGSVGKVTR